MAKDRNASRLAAATLSIARSPTVTSPVQSPASAQVHAVGLTYQEGARNRDTCNEFETDFANIEHSNGGVRASDLLSEMSGDPDCFDDGTASFRLSPGSPRSLRSPRFPPPSRCDRWRSLEQCIFQENLGDDSVVVATARSLLKFVATSKSLPCDTTDGAKTTERQSADLTDPNEPWQGKKQKERPDVFAEVMSENLGRSTKEMQGFRAQSHPRGFKEAINPSPCSSTTLPVAEDTIANDTMVEQPTTPQVLQNKLTPLGEHARHTTEIQEGSSQNNAYNPAPSSSGCSSSQETSLGVFIPSEPKCASMYVESGSRLRHVTSDLHQRSKEEKR